MFARLFAVASFAALAVAGPAPIAARDQCSTGQINCCNSVQQASQVTGVLSQFGLASLLTGVTGNVGLGCSPITLVGTGSNSCSSQVACCTGNNMNGLVNVGCSPINLGL